MIPRVMHILVLMRAADMQTALPEKPDSSTSLPDNWYCERHKPQVCIW